MKTQHSRKSGFTLVEIMIVVAIIGLLVTIAVPNYRKMRAMTQKNVCINNLNLIGSNVRLWQIEYKKSDTATYSFSDPNLLEYFKDSVMPTCPATGVAYTPGATLSASPQCPNSALGHTL